ncbi:MAG: PhnD/SsuA/transferrin family substrate-binding protein [Betaproteobacteria bacterium]|nr:PhnD/SsuA/transferrin family substrate-binding protein [Betaproteobacteria bacterium]
MYAINATVAATWRELLEWVVARVGVPCEIIDYPAPQPLPALWSRPDLGCAFMCGYPLTRAEPRPVVLAAPIPSPARYYGQPIYWSDLIVRSDASFTRIEDTFDRRFAFTTEESQSGYQAPRRFLAPHARARGGTLFAAAVGPVFTPRGVIEAIIAGDADVGPLDSYAHDLLRHHEPAVASRLRVISTTAPTPIPPLVTAAASDNAAVAELRAGLLAVATADALKTVRAALLLQGFAAVTASDYDVLTDNARAADRLGYPHIA